MTTQGWRRADAAGGLAAGQGSRRIAHVDLDCFYAAVEVLRNPALRGKPVVVGGAHGRGVVLSASYEARRYGVRAAMSGAAAKRLCPHAVFVKGTMSEYQRYSDAVYEVLQGYSPRVERASIDEAYLDLTGCERLWGPCAQAVGALLLAIRTRVGLPASAGVAGSKLTAKVATNRAKPQGLICIMPGYDRAFLAPLPLGELPGVGKKTEARLQQAGFQTIGDLAGAETRLIALYGDYGLTLARRARAEDCNPVADRHGMGSMSHERTFEEDTGDPGVVLAVLQRLTEKLGRRLRRHGQRARTVHLKIRYADFTTVTRSLTIGQPTDLDCELIAGVRRLIVEVFRAGIKVRLVGVGVSNLGVEGPQLDLWRRRELQRRQRLYQGLDQIRDRYGFEAVHTGAAKGFFYPR